MNRSPRDTSMPIPVAPVCTLLAALLPWSNTRADATTISADQLRTAATGGLAIVEKAAQNYPKHRKCFSCHHQTLPMQTIVTALDHGLPADKQLLKAQAKFTHASFTSRIERMRRGGGFDPITVGYGLWALYLAGYPIDETTDTMISRLLQSQRNEGSWGRGSLRPPIQQSEVTSVVLAVHYMPKFAGDDQQGAVKAATTRARAWLLKQEPQTQEDRNSQLSALSLLYADPQRIEQAKKSILDVQRRDGGWAQEAHMESDAYATGQTLFTLQRVGLPTDHLVYQRGLRFLLETQKPDGSWYVESRSEPIQIYFDNGDPYGKHQFISIAATSWATIAIAMALSRDSP